MWGSIAHTPPSDRAHTLMSAFFCGHVPRDMAPHTEKLVRLPFGRSCLSLVATFAKSATVSSDAALAVHVCHRAIRLDVMTESLASHAPELGEVPGHFMAANSYGARMSIFMCAA